MTTHHLDPTDAATPSSPTRTARLAQQDRAHVWHPFTPMRQWCASDPLVIERGEGVYLYDTDGRAFFDGVSSLWCNVHGHRVPAIDHAVRDQLDRIAHTTLLGLSSPPSITLASRLSCLTRRRLDNAPEGQTPPHQPLSVPELPPGHHPLLAAPTLNKTFYTDAGATALEVAFKMAVGHWHHRGQPQKTRFIGLHGAYHGDTNAAMSIGYSDLFHRAFKSMVFDVDWFPAPDAVRPPEGFTATERIGRACNTDPLAWPSEDPDLGAALADHCLDPPRTATCKNKPTKPPRSSSNPSCRAPRAWSASPRALSDAWPNWPKNTACCSSPTKSPSVSVAPAPCSPANTTASSPTCCAWPKD